ncbi:MAG: glycerophosphodiester phosphodiesterase [Candidatus Lokiarchaeota archaeon]|nr:glycerophosphodiester phosphodiesterase [Candidatus Lokiarchaeota archaeon]
MGKSPIIFAHRGASGYEYENTISAFDKAVELGANGIEIDCWLLKDGSIAIHHDRFIHTAGKFPKNISKMTKEDLNCIQLPNGSTIPLIQEVFGRYKTSRDLNGVPIKFSIDLQDLKVGMVLARIIVELNLVDRVYLCSHNVVSLHRIRKYHPRIKLIASNVEKIVNKSKFPCVQDFSSINILAINLEGKIITDAILDKIRKYSYQVFIWGLHSANSLQKCLKFHPNAIYTNYPDIAFELINHNKINDTSHA